MPEAAATSSAAPAASSASPGTTSTSAPAASMGAPSPASPQTTGGQVNVQAAAEAAISGKGREAVKAAYRPSPTPPVAEPAPSNPEAAQPTPGAQEDNYGFNPAQVQALKRAQLFDPDIINSIPPSNRKAWADKWAKKLSDNDRQYQLSRQNKSGDGQPAPQGAEAEAGETAGTPQDRQEGQPSQASPPFEFSEQGISQLVLKSIEPDAQESKTLVDQFGEDGLKAIRNRETRLTSAMAKAQMEAFKPLLDAQMHVLQWLQDFEFETGLADLRKQPGFEKLDASEANLKALREAAVADVRAKNSRSYRFRDAVKAVASQVFNVDPRLAAQAELGRVANPMLATSGARPSVTNPAPRPMTPQERMRAAADAATSGKGVQAVREAMNA